MNTVLHIEQSDFIRQLTSNLLEEKNFYYIPVPTAEKAYEFIKKQKMNIIITSMMIKDDTIENFIHQVNNSINKDTPLIVVSGNTLSDEKKRIIDLGVTDFISKDNFIEELNKHIEVTLNQDEIIKYLNNANVAVIDDSRLDLEVCKQILNNSGITNVDTFSSGKEVCVNCKKYDIYIIDVVLKEGFGNNLIMEIRKNNLDSFIIVVSSLTNTKTIANIMNAGANDFISKPLDENLFIAKLMGDVRAYIYKKAPK